MKVRKIGYIRWPCIQNLVFVELLETFDLFT